MKQLNGSKKGQEFEEKLYNSIQRFKYFPSIWNLVTGEFSYDCCNTILDETGEELHYYVDYTLSNIIDDKLYAVVLFEVRNRNNADEGSWLNVYSINYDNKLNLRKIIRECNPLNQTRIEKREIDIGFISNHLFIVHEDHEMDIYALDAKRKFTIKNYSAISHIHGINMLSPNLLAIAKYFRYYSPAPLANQFIIEIVNIKTHQVIKRIPTTLTAPKAWAHGVYTDALLNVKGKEAVLYNQHHFFKTVNYLSGKLVEQDEKDTSVIQNSAPL